MNFILIIKYLKIKNDRCNKKTKFIYYFLLKKNLDKIYEYIESGNFYFNIHCFSKKKKIILNFFILYKTI